MTRAALCFLSALVLPFWLSASLSSQARRVPEPSPATPREDVIETLHGVRIPDPYRWLEELDTPAVNAWVDSQTAYTSRFLEQLSARDAIGKRLGQLWRYPRTDTPWREAGQMFFLRNDGLQQQSVLYSATRPGQPPRVVFDPNDFWPDGSIASRDYVVSPDGRLLAYATAEGGADLALEHVREIATGRERSDRVEGVSNSVCWTKDSGGFFYFHPVKPDPSVSARWQRQFRYHVLGQPQSADRLIDPLQGAYRWGYCMISEDGRWAIAVGERGGESDVLVIRLDHQRPSSRPVRLLPGLHAMFTPLDVVGDTLYVRTDLDAPRQRVVALNLVEGARARARTVIDEAPHVIESGAIAGGTIVLEYLVDASSRLRLYTLDGRPAGEVSLPGLGSIGALNGRTSTPEVFYSFRSFLAPATVYRYDPGTRVSTAFMAPAAGLDARSYETRQVFYTSRDGTRVPMFITSRTGLKREGATPTLLTAYGGYGASITPSYLPDLPLWLEAGGIYAVANLRGGGEYGEAWHRAGMLGKKQNSFDDFIAAAEYLVSERYTSPSQLAIFGQSNGGLLMGAMITQRPDLFAAVVASAGHHDMLRYHKFTSGAAWALEYGSPDDPEAFQYLLKYSPLHRVKPGTCYPATLLLVADHDDRVVPSHSYKFAAALQSAQRCDQPILLRVARGASHSYMSTVERIAEATDMWAFIADRLGVSLATQGATSAAIATPTTMPEPARPGLFNMRKRSEKSTASITRAAMVQPDERRN
jgi:prolyl oligopeptidase